MVVGQRPTGSAVRCRLHPAPQVGIPGGQQCGGLLRGEQTRQALANIAEVLAASGAGLGDVITMRVFLTDTSQFDAMNEVYADAFDAPYPARTTVYVGLPEGLLVEIDALAVIGTAS